MEIKTAKNSIFESFQSFASSLFLGSRSCIKIYNHTHLPRRSSEQPPALQKQLAGRRYRTRLFKITSSSCACAMNRGERLADVKSSVIITINGEKELLFDKLLEKKDFVLILFISFGFFRALCRKVSVKFPRLFSSCFISAKDFMITWTMGC